MWKVGNIQPTTPGVGGQLGYGFNIENMRGAPLLSISYRTQAEAERARALLEQAIVGAIGIQ